MQSHITLMFKVNKEVFYANKLFTNLLAYYYSVLMEERLLKHIINDTKIVKNNLIPTQITSIKYRQLPKIANHHLTFISRCKLPPNIIKFLNTLTDKEKYQCLQYHPLYHEIISHLNAREYDLKHLLPNRLCLNVLSGKFVPLKLRDTVLSNYIHHYQISFLVGKRPVQLNLITKTYFDPNQLGDTIDKISLILQIVNILYQIPKTEPVVIYFYPTKYKKHLPEVSPNIINFLKGEAQILQNKGLKIGVHNYEKTTSVAEVNSALCSIGREKYIVIWREEDWTNRLLHELIHFYNLEKIETPHLTLGLNINNHIPINPNELITELQTFYLWMVYLAIINRYNNQEIVARYLAERAHLIEKAKLFLHHYDVQYFSCLKKRDKESMININNNGFYYYVLRGLAMSEVDDPLIRAIVPRLSIKTSEFLRSLSLKVGPFDHLLWSKDNNKLNFYLPE